MLSWGVVRDRALPGARNMALDHALARAVIPGRAIMRLYSWDRPTVSLGRNEPARTLYDAEALARRGVGCVRRPTGGRAVLHDRELTYAVVLSARESGGARRTYEAVNRALAAALRDVGATVDVVRGGEAVVAPVDAGPCFRSPAPGEVTWNGRKIVGSAQARIEGALLQHGSILLSGDQSLLSDVSLSEREGGSRKDEPATLADAVGPVAPDAVADAIVRRMAEQFGGDWSDRHYTDAELADADRLESVRYTNGEWTWRR